MSGRADRADRSDRAGDEGYTLIEVIVALFIFAVMSMTVLNVIIQTFAGVRSNSQRGIAADLLSRQIESVRTQTASAIPNGQQTYTRTVGNTVFTVTQTATYRSSNGVSSTCASGNGSLVSKQVTVTVTWPNMGTAAAPRADTLVALGIGVDNVNQPTLGTLALAVDDASGNPVSGIAITLTPGNLVQTTGSDGCIVFTNLSVGTYSATASQTGYVGTGSAQSTTVNSLGVIAGTITKGTIYYAPARTVTVTGGAPTGAVPPSTLPVHFGGSFMTDRTLPVCGTSPTSACISAQPFGTASELYPDVYTIWAGQCLDPVASSQVTSDVRTTATGTATVPLGAATITVTNKGAAEPNATVTVTRQSLSSTTPATCAGSETYSVSVGSTGTTQVALPYGSWKITGPGGATQTVPLTSTSSTATVTLIDTTH